MEELVTKYPQAKGTLREILNQEKGYLSHR
jgi:hypothetical protein